MTSLVPVRFTWRGTGSHVLLTGTWNSWGERTNMSRGGDGSFEAVLLVPPGTYYYKFVVDGEWKYDPAIAFSMDRYGNINNIVPVPDTPDATDALSAAALAPKSAQMGGEAAAAAAGGGGGGGGGAPGSGMSRAGSGTEMPRSQSSALLAANMKGFGDDLITPQRRRELAVPPGMGEASLQHGMKLVLITVGMPARGKTFIARKLARHLTWMGHTARIFNVGVYRRKHLGPGMPHDFFDPTNEEGMRAREQLATEALNDALNALDEGVDVAIFDGTNSTRKRRAAARDIVLERFPRARLIFIESVCHDEAIIRSNIRETKLNSPDYAAMPTERALEDFRRRIAHYERTYEPMVEEEGLSYIKLVDAHKRIEANLIQGFFEGRILFFLSNMNITPHPIWLSRHGESDFNSRGLIGGDSDLSSEGREYAVKLAEFMHRLYPEGAPLSVWTSTLRRTVQTAALLNRATVSWRQLDEIDAGLCDGMTYEEIRERMPDEFYARAQDKLKYRYPRGESYQDLIHRLEPVIIEIMRQNEPLLIVGHQAVLRVVYAYLMDKRPEDCPTLPMPLHTVIQLTPKAYTCEEVWHELMPDLTGTSTKP